MPKPYFWNAASRDVKSTGGMSGLFCGNVLRQLGIYTEKLLTGSAKREQTLSTVTLRRTPPMYSVYRQNGFDEGHGMSDSASAL